jgi:hypothetical protein
MTATPAPSRGEQPGRHGKEPPLTLRLSPTTKALVATACRERQMSASDLVESALVAFLSSEDNSVVQRLNTIETALGAIVSLLEAQAKAAAAEAATPPTATYEQMYGSVEPAPPLAETLPPLPTASCRPGRIRRWFVREESA